MSEYLTTESTISELSDGADEFNEMMCRNNFLVNELEISKKELKDKEFEMSNQINVLKFENENLKQTIKSYDELIEFYKNAIGEKNNINVARKSTSSDLIKTNLELIQKVTELENKSFNYEQNEHNLKREIFTLNSLVNQYKFEIEKINNETENSDKREMNSKFNKGNDTVIDENDIQELLHEIDDLKKEKTEVSERALNMLAEKELEILELRSDFEEMKFKLEKENLDFKKMNYQSRKVSSAYFEKENSQENYSNKNYDTPLDIESELNLIRQELLEKETQWDEEREKLNLHRLSLENSNRNLTHDYEMEIQKLKNENLNLELEKTTLEKELIKDKSSIENELEHYNNVLKLVEEQKEKLEKNSRNEINLLKSELKEADLTNSNLREQIFSNEKQISDLKNEHLKKINVLQEKWKTEITIKDNEITKLKNKIETLEKEKDVLRKEAENNRKNTEKTKIEYKDLLDQLRKLKEMNEEEKRKWEDKIQNIERTQESERNFLKNQIIEMKMSFDEKGMTDNFITEKKVNSYKKSDINLMDYNSEENPSILRNKVQLLESEIQKLNSLIKLKDNKSGNIFRLNGEVEILKKEKTKLKNEMNQMKEMYEIQIRDLVQKINSTKPEISSRKSSFKKPGDFNSKQLLENMELEEKIEQFKKENKFLFKQIEILKNEIENTKILKDNHINKLKEDVEDAERIAGLAKVNLAQVVFEKDSEVMKYKRHCKKYKTKLSELKLNSQTGFSNQINGGNYFTNSTTTTPQKKASFFQKLFNK